MNELRKLNNTEYNLVQKILWTYEDNQELLDNEKDRYSYWKEKMDRIRENINEEREIQNKFLKDKKDNNVEMLENFVGYYKLGVSYAAGSNDFAKKYLNELARLYELS